MQTENSFIDSIKNKYQNGGVAIKLIFINTAVFVIIALLNTLFKLLGFNELNEFVSYLGLNTAFKTAIFKPWTFVTSLFVHFGFMHLLFNMLFLYFAGQLFLQYFDSKKLVFTYILGGVLAGVIEMLARSVFPGLSGTPTTIVGASGSIMAIFAAVAFYRPKTKLQFPFNIQVPIILIAALFFLSDLINTANNDGVAHFAHIGGAIFGLISIQKPYSSRNILNFSISLYDRILSSFSKNKTVRMKTQKGGKFKTKDSYSRNTRSKSDEEYNMNAKDRQEKTDAILDKISKSGYDSLTKKEKEFLFNQSKNG